MEGASFNLAKDLFTRLQNTLSPLSSRLPPLRENALLYALLLGAVGCLIKSAPSLLGRVSLRQTPPRRSDELPPQSQPQPTAPITAPSLPQPPVQTLATTDSLQVALNFLQGCNTDRQALLGKIDNLSIEKATLEIEYRDLLRKIEQAQAWVAANPGAQSAQIKGNLSPYYDLYIQIQSRGTPKGVRQDILPPPCVGITNTKSGTETETEHNCFLITTLQVMTRMPNLFVTIATGYPRLSAFVTELRQRQIRQSVLGIPMPPMDNMQEVREELATALGIKAQGTEEDPSEIMQKLFDLLHTVPFFQKISHARYDVRKIYDALDVDEQTKFSSSGWQTTTRTESSHILNIPLQETSSTSIFQHLYKALRSDTREKEMLRVYKNNGERISLDRLCIASHFTALPNYLPIALGRITWNETGDRTKISTPIHASPTLVINKKQTGDDTNGLYHLTAIIYHLGDNADQGHYTCAIKHGDQWYKHNDSTVSPVPEQEVLSQAKDNALLMYQLVEENLTDEAATAEFEKLIKEADADNFTAAVGAGIANEEEDAHRLENEQSQLLFFMEHVLGNPWATNEGITPHFRSLPSNLKEACRTYIQARVGELKPMENLKILRNTDRDNPISIRLSKIKEDMRKKAAEPEEGKSKKGKPKGTTQELVHDPSRSSAAPKSLPQAKK